MPPRGGRCLLRRAVPSGAHVRPSVVRAEAAPERPEIRVAFGCLLAFTFILFVAPQTLVPGLEQFSLAKVSMVLAIATAAMGRLSAGLPVVLWLAESKLILGLWLWAGLSIVWSMWPGGSFVMLTDQFGKSVILFFVITSVVDSPRRLRILLASMVIWGVFVAGTVIRNYVEGHVIGPGRVVGFASPLADNPNDAALSPFPSPRSLDRTLRHDANIYGTALDRDDHGHIRRCHYRHFFTRGIPRLARDLRRSRA